MAPRLIRHRLTSALAGVSLVLAACSGSGSGDTNLGLEPRTTTIGGLEVKVTPKQLDAGGAAFAVVFDTHTGAPTIDVAAHAVLEVGGTTWSTPTWDGDGPGGHHRSGTLRFTPSGPAGGTARLTIGGLEQPVEATWRVDP